MWGGGRSSRSRKAKTSGVWQPQQTFEAVIPGASASGEADGDEVRKGLDMAVAHRLANFRAKFPVRGEVTWTNKMRPGRSEQVPWDHYRQFRAGKTARVDQEWWMPPLLVPLANKTAVGLSGDEALWQGPASGGGQRVVEHYTNIHRIEKLAEEHPLVIGQERVTKPSAKTIFDKNRRAVKGHQSEWNLRLYANHDVHMDVGVTAHDASADLLSLWWKPAANTRFNQEQESLARAVFMDVAEGYHLTPDTYAAELRELDRDRAGATGGASAASGTPQEPPAAASGGAGSSTDWYPVAGGAPSGNGPQSTAAAASAAPTRGVVPAQLAPVPPHFPPVPLRPPASSAAAAQPALSKSSALPTWPPPQPGPASGMGSPHSAPLDPDRCLPFLPKEAATSPAARHTAARHPAPVVWPQAASETSAPPRDAPLGPASGGLHVSAETAGPATAPKPPPRTFPVNAQLAEPPVQAASPSPPSAQQAPASVRPAPEAHATPPPPKEAQLAGPELPPQLSASRTPNWAEGESTAAEAARSSDKAPPRGLPLSTPPQLADQRQEEEIQAELLSEAAEAEAAASAPPAAPMPALPASAAAAPADSGPTPAAKPAPSRPGFGNYRRDADQEARDAAELDDWAARAHAEKVAAAAARASGDAGAGSSQTGGAHVQQSLRDTLGDDRRLGNRGRGSTRHPPEQQSDGEHSGWESASVTSTDDDADPRGEGPTGASSAARGHVPEACRDRSPQALPLARPKPRAHATWTTSNSASPTRAWPS